MQARRVEVLIDRDRPVVLTCCSELRDRGLCWTFCAKRKWWFVEIQQSDDGLQRLVNDVRKSTGHVKPSGEAVS